MPHEPATPWSGAIETDPEVVSPATSGLGGAVCPSRRSSVPMFRVSGRSRVTRGSPGLAHQWRAAVHLVVGGRVVAQAHLDVLRAHDLAAVHGEDRGQPALALLRGAERVGERDLAILEPEDADVRDAARRRASRARPRCRIAFAGSVVVASTARATLQPTWSIFAMVVAMSNAGPVMQSRCRSVLIVVGSKPWSIARRTIGHANEPQPWPMSKTTPRSRASQTSGQDRAVRGRRGGHARRPRP